MLTKNLLLITTLAILWIGESVIPFFQDRTWRARIRHDLRSLIFGLFNAGSGALFMAGLLVLVDQEATEASFGLLRQFSAPAAVKMVLAVLMFDLWMYAWHRLNHRVPFLWRFHRMHHSDPAMDAMSAVRFHPGEILLSNLARLAVVPLLGISIPQLIVYESILLPVVILHHANVRLPRWLDHGGMALLVTPAMHRVHHSRRRRETNSNYGSILPWWDWLFGSLRHRKDTENIEYGLSEYGEDSQTLLRLLTTPFRNPSKQERSKRDSRQPSGEESLP